MVEGCDFMAWDCGRTGGYSLGAVKCGGPATHLRREASPGTVRIGPADTLGDGMDGPGLEQRETHLLLGKRRGRRRADGELRSPTEGVCVCQSRSQFLRSMEAYGLGKTTLAAKSLVLEFLQILWIKPKTFIHLEFLLDPPSLTEIGSPHFPFLLICN